MLGVAGVGVGGHNIRGATGKVAVAMKCVSGHLALRATVGSLGHVSLAASVTGRLED